MVRSGLLVAGIIFGCGTRRPAAAAEIRIGVAGPMTGV